MIASVLDLLAANSPEESVDVLVTWVGAVTLIRYRYALGRRRERSALEKRTGFLISALALLLLLRGFAWLGDDDRLLGAVMLLPANTLPLAMTLFVEGLLRRHVARWIKWLAVALTGHRRHDDDRRALVQRHEPVAELRSARRRSSS